VQSSKGNFELGIIDYLAYGLNEYDKRSKDTIYNHSYYPSNTNLHLQLKLLGLKEEQKNQVLLALKSLISFGGLGAKSRNGFGSLYGDNLYINLSDLPSIKNEILLPYTAFSNKAKLLIFPKQDSWTKALSDIGMAYRESRLTLENKHTYTKRGYIGRPIVQSDHNEIKGGRHSKPFFLHVNKIGQNYQGQILFLPYHYYKPGEHPDYLKTCEELINKIEKIAKTKGVEVK
jgi:CRISPR-associated protein Cmr1